MADQVNLEPIKLTQISDQELEISWNDGHTSRYRCDDLRKACQCAVCVDEWTGKPRFDPRSVSETIRPRQIQGVGRYGIRIDWDDGHNTGIYTFKFLRRICPCAVCANRTAFEAD